jgi:uncharacterized protein
MEIWNNPPIVVLDTNVLLVALAPQSQYAVIFDSLIDGHFKLAVSTEIIAEYEEIIGRRYDQVTTNDVFELFLNLPNVIYQTHSFRFQLIQADADDNKFVDIAIAAQADIIVTDDKHYNILKRIPFPKMQVIKATAFVDYCKTLQR